MANLMLELTGWMTSNGLWGTLLVLFYNVLKNMGWTIVVFTICLKLVLVPLDIYQRHVSSETTKKQNEMKPELEKIQKIYANNQEMLNKKTMEVYRNHNFNLGTSCFGLLINIVITLVVFITLFNSLRSISNTLIKDEYEYLKNTYVESYMDAYQDEYLIFESAYDPSVNTDFANAQDYAKHEAEKKATEISQNKVYEEYQEIKESWLWIKNIYLTDTSVSPFPSFEKYLKNSGIKYNDGYVPVENIINGSNQAVLDNQDTKDINEAKDLAEKDYNLVCGKIIESVDGKWNGYYILIILSGVITWLSTKVTRLGQPKQTQKVTLADGTVVEKNVDPMGGMNLILPIMMIFFTWSYTGLFAIYIVVNSMIGIVISLAIYAVKTYIINPMKDKKKLAVEIANRDPNDFRRYDKYTEIETAETETFTKKNKNNKNNKNDGEI